MIPLKDKCPICGQRTELHADNEQLRSLIKKGAEILTGSLIKKVLVALFVALGFAANIIGIIVGAVIAVFVSNYLAKAINNRYYDEIERRCAPRDYAYRCFNCNEIWHAGESAELLITTHYKLLIAKARVKYAKWLSLILVPYIILMIPVGFVLVCYWLDCLLYGSNHPISQNCWNNSVLDVFGWMVSYTHFAFTYGLLWIVPVIITSCIAILKLRNEKQQKIAQLSSY